MPTFCRHNRLTANCSICSREQNLAMRPLVSGGSASAPAQRERKPETERSAKTTTRPAKGARPGTARTVREHANAVKVRKLARGAEDGFASPLLPGLKSSADAERLVEEVAFATARLTVMGAIAAGADASPTAAVGAAETWKRISDSTALDIEARTWLAFETTLSGERGISNEAARATITDAYASWVARAGSQQAAFNGEPSWTHERRFARIFERLAFKGLARDTRFELLVMLGNLGVYELQPGSVQLTGENEATWAAKRAMGIADVVLLERRVKEFAEACEAPLDALDLALHNWGSGTRIGVGIDPDAAGDEQVLAAGHRALGL